MRSNEIGAVLEERGDGDRSLVCLLQTLQKRAEPLLRNLFRLTYKGKHGSTSKRASRYGTLRHNRNEKGLRSLREGVLLVQRKRKHPHRIRGERRRHALLWSGKRFTPRVRSEGVPQTNDAPFVRDVVLRIRFHCVQPPTIHKETILPLFSFLYSSDRLSRMRQPWWKKENETMGGIMDDKEKGLLL